MTKTPEFESILAASRIIFPEKDNPSMGERIESIHKTNEAIQTYKAHMRITNAPEMACLPLGTAVRDRDGDVGQVQWIVDDLGKLTFKPGVHFATLGHRRVYEYSELEYPITILDIPYDND